MQALPERSRIAVRLLDGRVMYGSYLGYGDQGLSITQGMGRASYRWNEIHAVQDYGKPDGSEG